MKDNPYNIDFTNIVETKSFSHMHTRSTTVFERAYELGYRHFPGVHYSPSTPTYPLEDFYTNIPNDILGAPNSEKVNTTNYGGHFNALGSFAEGHGHPVGNATATWQEVFQEILDQLQFETGGGVTINHQSNFDRICQMLDFDDRVLGMEIYNNGIEYSSGYYIGYYKEYLNIWDRVLSTGRRCYGFAVVDWLVEQFEPWYGSIILLSDSFTEQSLLESYRTGSFYSILDDTGLRFTEISATETSVSVSINRPATIKFITENGVEKTEVGTNATYTVNNNTYVRVDVQEGENEYSRLFSNAIMFKDKEEMSDQDQSRIKELQRFIVLGV